MKYGQYNFVVTVPAKAESLTARMNEVFEVKMALAQRFLSHDEKFAIVGEDVVSNEVRVGARFNLIVSVLPKATGALEQIKESLDIENEIAHVLSSIHYRYIIAGEDMMSDFAKQKIQYLPKEDGMWMQLAT